MRMRSDEIIVGTADGVIKARTIRRRPEGEQWSAEEVENMKGTPSMPVPGVRSDNITSRVGREAEDEEGDRLQVEEEPDEIEMCSKSRLPGKRIARERNRC